MINVLPGLFLIGSKVQRKNIYCCILGRPNGLLFRVDCFIHKLIFIQLM